MNLADGIFILQLIVFLVILMMLFYNVMNHGLIFDLKKSLLLFTTLLIMNGLGLVISIYLYTNHLFLLIFNFESFLTKMGILFILCLVIFNFVPIKEKGKNNAGDPYYSNRKEI